MEGRGGVKIRSLCMDPGAEKYAKFHLLKFFEDSTIGIRPDQLKNLSFVTTPYPLSLDVSVIILHSYTGHI